MEIQRYFIAANGADDSAIAKALAVVLKLCPQGGPATKALILVPTRRQIQGTTLSTVIGERIGQSLLKGKPVPLGSASLTLATKQNYSPYSRYDVVLAVYADDEMLDKVEASGTAGAIVVVPWLSQDVERWRKTWNPLIPGQEAQPVTDALKSPVVQVAIKHLSKLVNLSTGLSHPLDRPKAVDMFRVLHKAGEPFDAEEVRIWATRNNWTVRGAAELSEIAQGILDGKRLRGEKIWSHESIRRWRAEAAEQSHEKNAT